MLSSYIQVLPTELRDTWEHIPKGGVQPPTLFFRDRDPVVRAACPPTARIIPLDMASENVERSVELAGAAERDDTLAAFCRAAHEMAAERDAPIPWNGDEGWQKTLNEMARTRFPRAREESAANGLVWERYLSEMWKDVMAGIWGPQWRKDLPLSPASRERVLRAAQADGRADSPPGTEGAVALMRDRKDRQAAGTGGGERCGSRFG